VGISMFRLESRYAHDYDGKLHYADQCLFNPSFMPPLNKVQKRWLRRAGMCPTWTAEQRAIYEYEIMCGDDDPYSDDSPYAVPGTVPCTIDFAKLERERQLPAGLSRKIVNPRVW